MNSVCRNVALCCIFFAASAVSRAAPAGAESLPVPVNDILKKVETHYQQTPAFTAEFRQFTSSAAAGAMATTEATGRLYYQKPRRMRWDYDKPEAQTFVANHEFAWLYVPSERQISLFDPQKFFSSPLARTFFEGVVELKNYFDISIDTHQSNKDHAVFKLKPKQEDPNIQSLQLWIDLKTYRIYIIESVDAVGNTNRIVLDSQTGAQGLDPALFRLEIPPGTALLDVDGRELTPEEIEKFKSVLPHQ